ncbi:hypothetical protein [Streptomyces boncukensis]|nr:hypothetical protein [Streptomyces boncukensis]
MAGVGKTALALHAGHALAADFPDGLLFYDLRGFRPDARPRSSEEALNALFRMIGFPPERIPATVDGKAAAWRGAVAGKRMLLVLDDAADAEQVRPLLPGTAGNLTIVTSRRRLSALDGATPLSLDVLPLSDAIDLFNRITGGVPGPRIGSLVEITELCDRLPLAVRIAAARLAHRPHWTVEHLAKQLRRSNCRLAELTWDDGQGVATALSVSYRRLGADHRRLFRTLGIQPFVEFDTQTVARVADISPEWAEALLEVMVDEHVVLQLAPGRYRLRGLMRALAETLVRESDLLRRTDNTRRRHRQSLREALTP